MAYTPDSAICRERLVAAVLGLAVTRQTVAMNGGRGVDRPSIAASERTVEECAVAFADALTREGRVSLSSREPTTSGTEEDYLAEPPRGVLPEEGHAMAAPDRFPGP